MNMGRNKEAGLIYFPFDIDTFQDIKIRKLISTKVARPSPCMLSCYVLSTRVGTT